MAQLLYMIIGFLVLVHTVKYFDCLVTAPVCGRFYERCHQCTSGSRNDYRNDWNYDNYRQESPREMCSGNMWSFMGTFGNPRKALRPVQTCQYREQEPIPEPITKPPFYKLYQTHQTTLSPLGRFPPSTRTSHWYVASPSWLQKCVPEIMKPIIYPRTGSCAYQADYNYLPVSPASSSSSICVSNLKNPSSQSSTCPLPAQSSDLPRPKPYNRCFYQEYTEKK